MKISSTAVLISLLLLLAPISMLGSGTPEQKMPVIDPATAPPGCRIPNGYSAACGYYASTAGGECACREGDVETTLCMKSNAGTGCGLYESPNDECCESSSGF